MKNKITNFSVIKGTAEPLQEHYNRQSKTLKKLRYEHAEILASFKILEEKTLQLEVHIHGFIFKIQDFLNRR
jgi:hypothetical protein